MNETVKPEAEEVQAEATEVASEQDDLDSLLNEYEEQEPAKPEPKEAPSPARDPMVETLIQRATSEDLSTAVNRFSDKLEDSPVKPSKQVLKRYLEGLAQEDSRFRNAWLSRYQNPSNWERVVDGVADAFKKEFEVKQQKSDTPEKEAAAAFVRGSSTKEVPEKPMTDKDLSGMSDAEFNKYTRGLLRG